MNIQRLYSCENRIRSGTELVLVNYTSTFDRELILHITRGKEEVLSDSLFNNKFLIAQKKNYKLKFLESR